MKSGSLNNAKTSDAGASYCWVTFNGLGTDCSPEVGPAGWVTMVAGGNVPATRAPYRATPLRTIITGGTA